MNRKWAWVEPGENDEPIIQTITEEELCKQYCPYWIRQMNKVGKFHLISTENCIEDFVTVHWAWEIKE